jgi:hypothetical protein
LSESKCNFAHGQRDLQGTSGSCSTEENKVCEKTLFARSMSETSTTISEEEDVASLAATLRSCLRSSGQTCAKKVSFAAFVEVRTIPASGLCLPLSRSRGFGTPQLYAQWLNEQQIL